MIINLSPQRRNDSLTVSVEGDVLTLNGTSYDFSSIPEGGELDADCIPCEFIIGNVERVDGHITLTLLLPHAPKPTEDIAFPKPITVTEDGPVALPGDGNVGYQPGRNPDVVPPPERHSNARGKKGQGNQGSSEPILRGNPDASG